MSEAADTGLPEGAELLADGKVRYKLAYPVSYKLGNTEQQLAEVTVRRKTFGDNLAIDSAKTDIQVGYILLQRLTGLDGKIVQQLDDIDHAAIGAIIASFTTPGRPTPTAAPG